MTQHICMKGTYLYETTSFISSWICSWMSPSLSRKRWRKNVSLSFKEEMKEVCCSVLQSVALCCNLLQRVNVSLSFKEEMKEVCCSVLHCVALCCIVLHCVAACECLTLSQGRDEGTLIERNPPPRGGFLFTMFPHQELCVRGPPSKNLVQILRGGSSYTRFFDEGT